VYAREITPWKYGASMRGLIRPSTFSVAATSVPVDAGAGSARVRTPPGRGRDVLYICERALWRGQRDKASRDVEAGHFHHFRDLGR